jgi:hypothetical protein
MGEIVNIGASDYVGRIWQFNEDEDAALEYLPHSDQVLYLRGMRKNMDFSNGTVGIKRGISYQGFKELLEVNRMPGSTKPSYAPSRDELRAMIARLVKVGLLERIHLNTGARVEPLAFKLPIAHTGRYSVSNIEPRKSPARANTHNNSVLRGACDGMNPIPENDLNPTHQLVRLKEYSTKVECENSNELAHCAEDDSLNLEKPKAVDQKLGGLGSCPHQEILNIWDSVLPARRSPNRNLWMKQTAAANLRSRWQEAAKVMHSNGKHTLYCDRESGLVFWKRFFTHLSKSKFLTSDDAKFFDLPWLLKKSNFYKALDGKYNNA